MKTLYHFCPAHLLTGIKNKGLTLGRLSVFGDGHITLISGYQWLTKDPDPHKQSWATKKLISYSRLECRLTIEVPGYMIRNLYKAEDIVQDVKSKRILLDEYPGNENWYVYKGIIPPHWIKTVARMET